MTIKNAGRARAKASQSAFALSRDTRSDKRDRALSRAKVKALAVRKGGLRTTSARRVAVEALVVRG